MLRNTMLINLLDRTAIGLPIHVAGDAPAGLMLAAKTMDDRRLLAIAAGVEAALV